MKKWRHDCWRLLVLTALCGLLAGSVPLVAQTPSQTSVPKSKIKEAAPGTIRAVDADDRKVVLNPVGRVTVVFLCTEQSQTDIRDASGRLDELRGLPNLRVIAVVDLRDSLGSMVEGIVRWRMREDLDDEAERLAPFYRVNGNQNDPRGDLSAIPDFKGNLCKDLGWPKVSAKLRGVVFGANGYPVKRWEELNDYEELYRVVTKALGK